MPAPTCAAQSYQQLIGSAVLGRNGRIHLAHALGIREQVAALKGGDPNTCETPEAILALVHEALPCQGIQNGWQM